MFQAGKQVRRVCRSVDLFDRPSDHLSRNLMTGGRMLSRKQRSSLQEDSQGTRSLLARPLSSFYPVRIPRVLKCPSVPCASTSPLIMRPKAAQYHFKAGESTQSNTKTNLGTLLGFNAIRERNELRRKAALRKRKQRCRMMLMDS